MLNDGDFNRFDGDKFPIWDTSKEAIEARTTEISKYLTKELQDLNADTIRTDIPTSATVTNVLVWNVEQSGTDDFTVAY